MFYVEDGVIHRVVEPSGGAHTMDETPANQHAAPLFFMEHGILHLVHQAGEDASGTLASASDADMGASSGGQSQPSADGFIDVVEMLGDAPDDGRLHKCTRCIRSFERSTMVERSDADGNGLRCADPARCESLPRTRRMSGARCAGLADPAAHNTSQQAAVEPEAGRSRSSSPAVLVEHLHPASAVGTTGGQPARSRSSSPVIVGGGGAARAVLASSSYPSVDYERARQARAYTRCTTHN